MDNKEYWDGRYRRGKGSGEGSRGETASQKARYINKVVRDHQVRSIIDWGCGDGVVLSRITPAVTYIGVDVSPTIIDRVSALHPTRTFYVDDAPGVRCEMALSFDVLFHFQDDEAYFAYLDRLFGSATRLVLIYSTNHDAPPSGNHMRRRRFTPDIGARFPGWRLIRHPPTGDEPGYYLYARDVDGPGAGVDHVSARQSGHTAS